MRNHPSYTPNKDTNGPENWLPLTCVVHACFRLIAVITPQGSSPRCTHTFRVVLLDMVDFDSKNLHTQDSEPSEEDAAKDAESRAFAVAMAKLGWETKAEEVTVLHVAPLVYWCSYMVILNIKSRPQLQAVIAKMEKEAEEEYGRTIASNAQTSRYVVLWREQTEGNKTH
jgi:hypothetical protein